MTYDLDLKELHLPPTPPVESVRVAEVIDSIGDQAFRVWVVLKEPLSDEDWNWKRLRPIEEEIRQYLRQRHGSDRFPYLRFLTPSEMRQEIMV